MKSVTAGWQDWASFALGLWLAVSPWVCAYADQSSATANAVFVGIALALVSSFQVGLAAHGAEWLNFAVGLWLVAAPFALGFAPIPAVNSMAVGAAVILLAASALSLDKEIEKWWHRRFLQD